MNNSEATPKEHKEWEHLLTGAIGDKNSYTKAEVLWAMYLAGVETIDKNTDTNG